MALDGCNFYFFILSYFLHVYPPKSPKNQKSTKKKRKKHLEISSFYTNVPKIMIICYNVPEIWRLANANFIFYLGPFCVLFPPATPVPPPAPSPPLQTSPENRIFKKMKNEKNTWRYHHFTHFDQNL